MPNGYEQLDFEYERARQITDGIMPITEAETNISLEDQRNELELAATKAYDEGQIGFDDLRKIAASRSPDPKVRFYALNSDRMADPDLVKPQTAEGRRRIMTRHERNPNYYEKDGSIRKDRLSSKEKGLADSPPEHVRDQFRKF